MPISKIISWLFGKKTKICGICDSPLGDYQGAIVYFTKDQQGDEERHEVQICEECGIAADMLAQK